MTDATGNGAFLRELRFKSGRVRLVRNGDGEIYSLRRRSWMQCPLRTAMQVFISTKRNTQEKEDMGTLPMKRTDPKGTGERTLQHTVVITMGGNHFKVGLVVTSKSASYGLILQYHACLI